MNGLNNFDKTDRENSLAPADDLIRFWRSKVKVTPWLRYVVVKASIYIDSGSSKSSSSLYYVIGVESVVISALVCCVSSSLLFTPLNRTCLIQQSNQRPV